VLKRSKRYATGIMLATLLAGVGALLYLQSPGTHLGVNETEVITAAGELRELTLGPHTLNINQLSSLTITESHAGYSITLHNGEAAFLTGRTNRYVTVKTADVTVRGDNGLFGIRTSRDGGTYITTSKDGGDTSISCPSPNGWTKTLKLHADQSVHIDHDCELQLGRLANNSQAPELWPHEELRFRNVRLVDAIGDFNTYYQQPIRIDSEALSHAKISGAFNPLDRGFLLEYIKTTYGARATQGTDGSMRLVDNRDFSATHSQ
jgi:ferric-dicitrate binding protein FerR (iron transport regulator)